MSDVEQGKLVRDQRIIIVGNNIQAVADVGAVEVLQGAQVVDARSKYLKWGDWNPRRLIEGAARYIMPLAP